MRRAGWTAAAAVIGWYAFALWILHPLTEAPVVDSWLYGSAVRRFLRTGELRFAGFTQDMPIAQVFYGVGWAHAFGANSVSLEMSKRLWKLWRQNLSERFLPIPLSGTSRSLGRRKKLGSLR